MLLIFLFLFFFVIHLYVAWFILIFIRDLGQECVFSLVSILSKCHSLHLEDISRRPPKLREVMKIISFISHVDNQNICDGYSKEPSP